MTELTSVERLSRQLEHKSVDRIAISEEFWPETLRKWRNEGHLGADEDPVYHFDMDLVTCWVPKYPLDPDFTEQILAEDDDTVTFLNGNAATMRRHKKHASTPEHLNYAITSREEWEEKAKPMLLNTPLEKRMKSEYYVEARTKANAAQKFFCYAGIPIFECLHPICGHEHMLMGMALDPEWIQDMSQVYADLNIALMEETFSRYGLPDGVWFYEDMGFKGRPFMSPDMYMELIQPYQKQIFDYVHSRGLKVIVHSCGFIEPLIPGMIEAGMDCLEAMEVKAGMDLLRIHKNFGDKIALMGGLDVRPVATNNPDAIRQEVASKLPHITGNYGYIFHSDHSIPESTEYESARLFFDLAKEFGTYKL